MVLIGKGTTEESLNCELLQNPKANEGWTRGYVHWIEESFCWIKRERLVSSFDLQKMIDNVDCRLLK
jgi:hypothetical protein